MRPHKRMKLKIIRQRFQIGGAVLFGAMFMLMMLLGIGSTSRAIAGQPEDKPKEIYTVVSAEATEATVIITEAETITEPDKQYYNIPLSNEMQDYIFETAKRYEVPPELVIAIIQKESNYKTDATGAAGEQGYMQIHPVNFEWLSEELGITDFYDPEQNILAGIYMLSGLCERYETQNEILMCYNCGEGGAKKLWNKGITETEYCRRIADIIQSIKKA